ncbi:phage tail domain-containing protein [Paenibacillus eucommiae]|uniref:Phage-related protein n=1 Tax=Paenibacillus eucommiae TaxID=1355755 RepID=A0ABS4IY99_9BACL|nr:phage tail domain-containing protein [Paenibacillus eucommiae]MBP1992552.1 phage-related protein [Paenibacillus eucommiae]
MIRLDGVPIADYGLIMQPGHDHPLAPATIDRSQKIQGRNGLLDWGSDIGERAFSFPLAWAQEPNRHTLQQKIEAFTSVIFDGYGKPRDIQLVFDYETDVAYTARYKGAVSTERTFNLAFFSLPMVAHDPLRYSLATLGGGDIILNSDIILERDIKLDGDDYSFSISAPTTVDVNNFGTMNAFPTIKVVGSFSTFSLSTGGKTLVYSESLSNNTLLIDTKRMTCKIGSTNKLNKLSGSWLDLARGVNQISISGTGLNCSVSFIFRPSFL